jgi:hypothetical protein
VETTQPVLVQRALVDPNDLDELIAARRAQQFERGVIEERETMLRR